MDVHSRLHTDYLFAAIRRMARSDARELGALNEPSFDDARDIWEELEDPDDSDVLHALRTFMEKDSRRVYRDEWSRIRAEFYGFIK